MKIICVSSLWDILALDRLPKSQHPFRPTTCLPWSSPCTSTAKRIQLWIILKSITLVPFYPDVFYLSYLRLKLGKVQSSAFEIRSVLSPPKSILMNSLTEIGTGCFQYSSSLTGNDVAPPIPGVFSPSQCQFFCQVWASLSYRWQHKSNIDSLSQFFLSATNLHYVYFSLWHCQQSIFSTYIKIGILYLSM